MGFLDKQIGQIVSIIYQYKYTPILLMAVFNALVAAVVNLSNQLGYIPDSFMNNANYALGVLACLSAGAVAPRQSKVQNQKSKKSKK